MDMPSPRLDPLELKEAIDAIIQDVLGTGDGGKASDAIPVLADLDPQRLGIAVVPAEGDAIVAGEADEAFSIQSISKVFALSLALEAFQDDVWQRVGREPSGDPFNSIVDLERHKGMPRNPFINTGAIVVADLLLDRPAGLRASVRDFLVQLCGDESIVVDEAVRDSELSGAFNNRALANLAKAFGNLKHDVDAVLESYIGQCAIAMSCRQLAEAGRYLMTGHFRSLNRDREEARRIRRVLSLMMTCGQYDGSGDFAFRVGLPAKSGIGGGILAIVPDVASIAVWSPGLDENGNSLLGTLVLERLSERMGWSVFGGMKP